MSSSIADLRKSIAAIETQRPSASVLSFGLPELDARLVGGGVRIDALHESTAIGAEWGEDASALLFLAGIAARNDGQILWIVRRRDLFAPALAQAGLRPERLVHAEARNDVELLAAMEDALRHGGLSAVIGEVGKVSLTATRRLQLAAEGGTTLALLLRHHARSGEDPFAQPSAAMTRWRIGAAPSAPLPVNGIGRARWRVELVRQRGGAPFELTVEACDETGRCALAAELVDRPDSARRADARTAA